jgi:hypothetical protein
VPGQKTTNSIAPELWGGGVGMFLGTIARERQLGNVDSGTRTPVPRVPWVMNSLPVRSCEVDVALDLLRSLAVATGAGEIPVSISKYSGHRAALSLLFFVQAPY